MKPVRSDAGFSLVEMMVVVAIVGLMASAVVLAMPSTKSEFRGELVRTKDAMEVLARRSVMTGRIIGVRFRRDGFDTLRYDDQGWVDGNDILKPDVRVWAPLAAMKLSVAGSDVDLSKETIAPHIWFLPTGEQLDFELALASNTETGSVQSFATGGFEVKTDE